MESDNGVRLEDQTVVSEKNNVEESLVDIKKAEEESFTNVEQISNASVGEVESNKTFTASTMSKSRKAPGSNNSKINNISKDRIQVKGSTVSISKGKPTLAQNRSFTASGHCKEGMDNSKNSQTNESKVDHVNPASRRASIGVNSREANTNGGGASSRRSIVASLPNVSHFLNLLPVFYLLGNFLVLHGFLLMFGDSSPITRSPRMELQDALRPKASCKY